MIYVCNLDRNSTFPNNFLDILFAIHNVNLLC